MKNYYNIEDMSLDRDMLRSKYNITQSDNILKQNFIGYYLKYNSTQDKYVWDIKI